MKVVGEFGGHGLVLPEQHLWKTRKHWGYQLQQDVGALEANYERSMEELCQWIFKGIAAGVYLVSTCMLERIT